MTKLGLLIVELLTRDGPMHTPGICKALDRNYVSTVPIITSLVKEKAIEIVGTAAKFGFTDVRSIAPVYAASGIKVERIQTRGKPAITPPDRNRARIVLGSGEGV